MSNMIKSQLKLSQLEYQTDQKHQPDYLKFISSSQLEYVIDLKKCQTDQKHRPNYLKLISYYYKGFNFFNLAAQRKTSS